MPCFCENVRYYVLLVNKEITMSYSVSFYTISERRRGTLGPSAAIPLSRTEY
jgi:hypothetical protein